ncbi:MAG TPA: DUF1294 domain-containing protein [Telluria sp.]|nr:DUF1294 domain-containing protein [Telluria sp.]
MSYLPIDALAALPANLKAPIAVLAVYVAASLVTFLLYAFDKRAAVRRARRTPERTLLLAGLACGWPGALMAQQWLRHKSSKTSFLAWFWITVALNAAMLILLVRATDWL